MNEDLLLTPQKIEKFRVYKNQRFQNMAGDCDTCTCVGDIRGLLQAQLDKVLKWLNEPCPHALSKKQPTNDPWLRRECSECWEAIVPEKE